jgi:zinc finger SWIM domain-containing protein 3
MKHALTLGIRSTQASESINSTLKNYLNYNLDINKFLEHFKRVVDGKREKEIKFEYEMRRALSKIKFNVSILREARKLYTTKLFELFQAEFELSGSAQIKSLSGNSYTVGMCDVTNTNLLFKSRQVTWSRDDQTISCSCKKFEIEGILCWHALKLLDREDIKSISSKYILKRWIRDVKNDTVMDREGRMIIEDAMLDVRNRNGDMIHEIAPTCAKTAYDEEQTEFMLKGLCSLREQYDEKYENRSKRTNNYGEANSTTIIFENSLHLKKKVGEKRSK